MKLNPMPSNFTIYCWFENKNRFQQSNFRRWNRCLKKQEDSFEVIVFYDDPDIKKEMDRYTNLRFWRLHRDMRDSPTGLMNEAIRYSRSEILVYVSPDVLARKIDIYRLANFSRSEHVFSWLNPAPGFYHENQNKLMAFINHFRWLFRIGRIELYSIQNKPFDFYRASFFAFHKSTLDKLFSELSLVQKEKLLKNDQKGSSYLNYYLFHLILKSGLEKINAGNSKSFEFISKKPELFYSYKNTRALIRQVFSGESYYFPVHIYRFLLPVMQLTQVVFFILVWFSPFKSLFLLAFYGILALPLADFVLKKKKWYWFVLPMWFFGWLVA